VISGLEKVGAWVADVNVGVSYATKQRIPEVSQVIPNGVDMTRLRPGQKSEKPSVLFVGTTGGRKRGTWLAKIFCQQVRAKFPDAELWSVAEKSMEGEGIVNFGRVSQDVLCDLYQKAWVFCLPSTYEGFGIPYVEALAAGTSVVAAPNVGAREILAEGKYGIIAQDDQIGAQIVCLLGDENLRRSYAEKGLVRAQDFEWDKVVRQYEAIYADLKDRFPKKR
jgi:glycosyltransferase involved in cell wall biosynthesis